MREHKRDVVSVAVTKDEAEIMTASKDGTCIIWALQKYGNYAALFRTYFGTSPARLQGRV